MSTGMPLFEGLDLRDASVVAGLLVAGAQANLNGPARRGSIERIELRADDRVVLTGDLHDNPLHLARLVRAAGMDGAEPPARPAPPPAHLTLHELIHGDRLSNGMDFSYRVLARAAALKTAFPHHVHTLLANHELSQIVGAGIVKDGVRVVEAFNDAVEYTFGDQAPRVADAIAQFIRSMPLAVRFVHPGLDDILCAHSLPPPELMDRFDPGVLERELVPDDLVPRRGSAHLMVWGRGHTPEQLAALAQRWNAGAFVLGHEKAEDGLVILQPNTVVLNSDHDRGVYLDVAAATPRDTRSLAESARSLAN